MLNRLLNKVKLYSNKLVRSGKTYGNLGSTLGSAAGGLITGSPLLSLPSGLVGRRIGHDSFSTIRGLRHGVFSKHPKIRSLPLRKRIGISKNVAVSNARKLNNIKPYKGDTIDYALESGIETVFPKIASIPGASTALVTGGNKLGKAIKRRAGFNRYNSLAEFNLYSLGDYSFVKV